MITEVGLITAVPQLPSANLDRTARFYESHLEFKTHAVHENFLIMKRDEVEIHFWKCTDPNIAKNSSCYFHVKGVAPLFTSFVETDAPFAYTLRTQPWGMNEFQVTDPDGNAIRFGEPV